MISKALVNYRESDSRTERRCGTCVMYKGDNACSLVEGYINPEFVCDRWEKQDEQA